MEASRSNVRGGAFALLFFILVCGAFFSPFLLQGRLLAPGDGRVLSLPHFYAARTLWTSHIFSGFPALADPQTFTCYPPAMLLSWVPNSFNLFVLSGFVLAGCFTFGLVHRLTESRTAGLLAGIVYAFSGFSITHLGHTNIIHAACWLPLWLWAVESLRHSITPGAIAVGAGAVALSLFSGHPQIPAYLLALGTLYAFALGGPSWRERWRSTAATLASAVLGLGLGAALLVPMAELTAQSARASMDFDDFTSYALPPNQWTQLLLPAIHGGMFDPFRDRQATVFGSGGGVLEATGYVGLLPWALASIAVAVGLRRQPQVRFWLGVALITVLLSFGKQTPLGSLTFQLPVWNRFRIPTRHLMEFSLALAVLAGLGIAELQRCDAITRRRWARNALLGLAGAFVLALIWFAGMVASGLYTRHMTAIIRERVNLSILPWHNSAVAVPLALLVVASVALWMWGRRPGRLTGALLCAVLVLDLGTLSWLFLSHRFAADAHSLECPTPLQTRAEELRASGQRLLPLDPYRLSGGAPPNLSRLWGMPSVSGYCPLVLRRYSELTGINYIGFDDYHILDPNSRVLDILSTRYVLTPAAWLDESNPDLAMVRALRDGARFRRVADLDDLALFENLRAQPRAWLTSATLSLPSEEVCRTIRTGRLPSGEPFDPAAVALVSGPQSVWDTAPDPDARVRVVQASDTRIELETQSATPAFLVLSDADYPGWCADVDGRSIAVTRTNYVQRGLPVPSGTHRVRFMYRPRSVAAGGAVSALCMLLTAGLVIVHLRRRNARAIGSVPCASRPLAA